MILPIHLNPTICTYLTQHNINKFKRPRWSPPPLPYWKLKLNQKNEKNSPITTLALLSHRPKKLFHHSPSLSKCHVATQCHRQRRVPSSLKTLAFCLSYLQWQKNQPSARNIDESQQMSSPNISIPPYPQTWTNVTTKISTDYVDLHRLQITKPNKTKQNKTSKPPVELNP